MLPKKKPSGGLDRSEPGHADDEGKAEELLAVEVARTPVIPTGEVQKVVHELSVHQVELETQNEELRQAQVELAHARDRYADLYEFAPVGYMMIDGRGLIREANFAVATMLGIERQALVGAPFSKFVANGFQDAWHLYCREVLEVEEKQSCELELRSDGGAPHSVRLEGIAFGPDGERCIRAAILDVSAQKEAELIFDKLNISADGRLLDRTTKLNRAIGKLRLMSLAVGNLGEGVLISENRLERPGPKIIFANKALCDMTGYKEEEILGRTPRMFQGAETSQAVLGRIKADLSAGRSATAELINYDKGGSPYHAELFISQVFDENGRPTHFISVQRDISDRKQAEDALQRSEERFRKVFENSPVGIAIRNREGYFEQCNRAYCQLLGYSENDLRSLHYGSLIHPDDRELNLEQSRLLQAGEIPCFEIENRYLHRDGSLVWVNKFVSLLHQGADENGHVISLVSDVTERRHVMQELRDRDERLRAIMNATPDAIVTADQQGRIVVVNPATCKLFGYSDTEMIGMQVDVLLPPSQSSEEGGVDMRKLQGQGQVSYPVSVEGIGRRRDGTVFPVEMAISPVDHMDLFTGIIRDVTRNKRLQKEVINASENERLTIARDLHDDLGSLLTGVKLGVESLAGQLKQHDQKVAAQAKVIALQVSEAMGKIRGIAAGLRPAGMEPDDLMGALGAMARRMEDASGMKIQLKCPQPILIGEPVMANHLFRIAQEAVSNAVRHSGGKTIWVSFESSSRGVKLVVEDDGKGIDSKGDPMGGLGLSTMGYRAHALKGTLRIGGRRDGGTRVVCYIPSTGGG